MAGKVLYSETNEKANDAIVNSPPSSYEDYPSTSNREGIGDVLPSSRTCNKMCEGSSELSPYNQLQEQYMVSVKQHITKLKNIRRENEDTLLQVKKTVRDKVDNMLKLVKQSFEHMHVEGTKQIVMKYEEIGRVLSRVEKMLEEGNQEFTSSEVGAFDREKSHYEKFMEKSLEEKSKIESDVETVIEQLNKKRENDEQMFMEFKKDIQQQLQSGMSCIEESLESTAELQIKIVEEKITELRRALTNLQHLSKFS